MIPKGYVTVAGVFDENGRPVPMQEAVERGWITPAVSRQPGGWGMERHEVPLGPNLFVDNGRQLLAFAFGGRSPADNFSCKKFGVGTGTLPATATDVALHNPVVTSTPGVYLREIDGVDFMSPFMVRVGYTIASGDFGGYSLTERGLFSGNDTLLARHVSGVPINKSAGASTASYKLFWRLRF